MSAPRRSGRATSRCHACGNPVAVADAYARIAIGGETFLLCCPICLSSVEAGRVQRLLVPSSFSDECVDVRVEYVPAQQVGGDYACIRYSPGGRLYLVVGDVSGHGLTSSILMSRLGAETERFVERDAPLGSMAEGLNERMRSWFGDEGLYVTFFGSLIDFDSRTLSYVNCGHPAQLWWWDGAAELARMESHNMPVGLFDNDILGPVLEKSFPLRGNDRLMLFTDGLLELQERSGEELGQEGVERLFTESVQTPLDGGAWNPLSQLRSLRGRSRNDDVLAVMARLKGTRL